MRFIQTKVEAQDLSLVFLVGFFLFSVAYFSLDCSYTIPFITAIESRTHKQNQKPDNLKCEPCGMYYDKMNESSSPTINGSNREANISIQLEYESSKNSIHQRKPKCDLSDPRYDLCEVDGDVRIQGKFTSIQFLSSSERNESWRIQPYPRKQDSAAMKNVREVILKSIEGYDNLPLCTFNHSVPAIVFSTGGYTGNYFHDFADVLIPLFITSYRFYGEVQLVITDIRSWWIQKYLLIFSKLSNYKIINFDDDNRVHCFPHAIIGLTSHKELNIDPSRSPSGLSMVNFAKFLKSTYSLPREYATQLSEQSVTKPRLLLIARSSTRKFINLKKIVRMAEKLGYEVVVMEADSGSNLSDIAELSNSCDVMMGVHGAGLTNLVFLPMNAVVIQIVPWGRLELIANTDYGLPAIDMNLKYLEYSISEEESTLTKLYPRNHTVFKDPLSIHEQGWIAMGKIYLVKQNVKLNVRRFKPVLLQALKLLHVKVLATIPKL